MMTSLSTNKLIVYVQENIVNPYIRERDKTCFGKCISCGGYIHDACHYYSVGANPAIRFYPENIHGGCRACNSASDASFTDYTIGLINRHGEHYLWDLEAIKQPSMVKLMRSEIIEIANTYKHLLKHKIWVFTMSELKKYIT